MLFLNKKLIVVTGKGGVGKSSVCLILATLAQKLNKKVLLIEIDKKLFSQNLEKFDKNIWGFCINPKIELEEYIAHHVGSMLFNSHWSQIVSNKITKSKIFEHFTQAAPGLKEIMILGRIWRFFNFNALQNNQNNLSLNKNIDAFDLIIVDAQSTGYGISLLKQPKALIDMLKIGPLVEQTKIILNLLQDSSTTGICLVTIPEELPINEALETIDIAQNDLNMPIDAVFINLVYPELFDYKEKEQIKNFKEPKNIEALFKTANIFLKRQENQQKFINKICQKLKEQIKKPEIFEIPFCFTNDFSSEVKTNSANFIAKI